jgi:hypothetical protein
MKIFYQRTGGFAGMRISYDIDVEKLPPEEADTLGGLVSKANFFELPSEIQSDQPGADNFHYELTVEIEEQQHTVAFGDATVPENLGPILDKIRILSRTGQLGRASSNRDSRC